MNMSVRTYFYAHFSSKQVKDNKSWHTSAGNKSILMVVLELPAPRFSCPCFLDLKNQWHSTAAPVTSPADWGSAG